MSFSLVGRIAAVGAVAAAGLAVAIVLLSGGEDYKVTAKFQSASQLVGGEQVVVAGVPVGSVEEVALGPEQSALVTFTVSDEYAPLRRGTTASVAPFSLSGIANRQVRLTLPPDDRAGEEIPDGGVMELSETVSAVELDQVFNTLDERTVADLKRVIQGLEISYDGVGRQANRGFRYLNPFLFTSRRLFGELTRDGRNLERLLVDTSQLSGALAARRDDVSLAVHNLNLMMGAIGRQREALAQAVANLPDFMRRFNTTAVNLRATLDDLDPLVDASKPAAVRLQPFFTEFRAAAADAVPTVSDLERIIRRKRPANDLIELTKLQVPLSEIAVGPVRANGEDRRGAFPESVASLEDSLPQLEFFRAYTPELVGWFNDFGGSGVFDANGGIGRFSVLLNAFTPSLPGSVPNPIPGAPGLDLDGPGPLPPLPGIPPESTDAFFNALDLDNDERCPGANERDPGDGSTPFTDGGTIDCDPSQVPPGP
jgi:phospholipid/cholesterol/gamma-HCH transport system substrate-binding protein